MSRASANRPSLSQMRKIDGMLRTVLLGVALMLGCGGGSDTPAPSPAETSKDAGKVVEVSGTVTATRGGVSRTLAVGYLVSSDDVIDTAKDGSVVIELFHNNARWTLESGLKTRVDESVAWGLPKQEVADRVDHASSAAGRHGDRQAADTSVSYKKKTAVDFPDETIEGDLKKPTVAAAPAEKPSAPKPTAAPKPTTVAPRAKPAEPARAKADEIDELLSGNRKGGGGGGGGARAPSSPSDLPDAPGRQDIVSAMSRVKDKIIACNKDPNLKGTFKIAVTIGPSGAVTSATIAQSLEAGVDACAVEIIKTLKFPASKNGVTFSFPFVIN